MLKSDNLVDTISSFENRLHTVLCAIRKFCVYNCGGPGFVSIPDQLSKSCMTDSKKWIFFKT